MGLNGFNMYVWQILVCSSDPQHRNLLLSCDWSDRMQVFISGVSDTDGAGQRSGPVEDRLVGLLLSLCELTEAASSQIPGPSGGSDLSGCLDVWVQPKLKVSRCFRFLRFPEGMEWISVQVQMLKAGHVTTFRS